MLADREVYTLIEPVEFAGKTVTEVAFVTRIRGKHMRGIPLNAEIWDHQLKFLAALSGQPDAFFGEVGLEDLQAMTILTSSFLGSRRTGATGSPSSPESSDSAPASS